MGVWLDVRVAVYFSICFYFTVLNGVSDLKKRRPPLAILYYIRLDGHTISSILKLKIAKSR